MSSVCNVCGGPLSESDEFKGSWGCTECLNYTVDPASPPAQTPTKNTTVFHEAAGNLAFLLSVIRCGETLSELEEENIRRVIRRINEAEQAFREWVVLMARIQ